MEKEYAVYRVYRDDRPMETLYTDLTREEAMDIVKASPTETDSMVVFNEL